MAAGAQVAKSICVKWQGLIRIVLVVGTIGYAAPAAAQTDGRVALGASFTSQQGTERGTHVGGGGLGFLFRLGQGGEGWGIKYGTNWYSADIDQDLGGNQEAFGRIRIRPIMVGYGYTRSVQVPLLRNAKISANVMGGYSFNSFKLQPAVSDVYRQRFNLQSVEADASNTFVMKPEVSLWFDVAKKVGINVGAGYMIARPTVTVSTPGGPERHRVDADMFMFKVGAVYSVF